jgi:hypothetical protein
MRYAAKNMNSVSALQDNAENGRTFHVMRVERLVELSKPLAVDSSGFVLFLALDARALSNEEIRSTARCLLDMGCAYLSVWGPDCERVHDQFDLERDPNEQRDYTVMTTWHDKDPIEKALWFSLTCAWPADGMLSAYQHWVGVSVGSNEWEQRIREAISTHDDD